MIRGKFPIRDLSPIGKKNPYTRLSQRQRKLAAIMFTDLVGYTSLSQDNEALALRLLDEHRTLVRPFFSKHNGREVKTVGDAFLVEFPSALEAVRCAFDIQQSLQEMNSGRTLGKQVQVRVGVHLGDVVHDQNDVYGDAVNIASRIEPLAMPGGICVSQQVFDQIKNKFEFPLSSLGKKELKNVREPIEVYRVVPPWENQIPQGEPRFPANRIAILPFTSFSLDPNDAFFADGMTEEIISTVSGLSGLNVISRTSVMGYKGTTKKVEEIGRELKVGSILEGSFRKAGNRIRVTTQLIEVAGDRHLWAQNYDRELNDVFGVQSDVAKQVAEALRVRILSPERERIEKMPTESTRAYTLYLRGIQLWSTRKLEDIKKAKEYFEQAVAEDPGFALGYAGQADCCLLLRSIFNIDNEANFARAKMLATKALELDPGLAEAHATTGFTLQEELDFQQAEDEFRKAIELKPSYATARHRYSILLRNLMKWDEALEQIEKAEELDPLSPVITANHSECLEILGRMEESLRVFESAERLNPDSHLILWGKALLLMHSGKMDQARECIDKASKVDPENLLLLDLRGHYEQLVGDYAKAVEQWERAVKKGKMEGVGVWQYDADFASVYWMSGNKSRALDYVKALEARPEENRHEHAYRLLILSFAYAGTGNAEKFFSTAARMVQERQADFGFWRILPTFYPSSREFLKDPRWSALFRSAGLEP